ncbi:4-hydroxybenzoate octaprenyltransferase [Methylocystis sp. S23]
MSLARERGDDAALPDSQSDHPLWRHAPAGLRPYIQLARLDRPIGWWLLLLPCWESSALASAALHQGPKPWHLTLFFIGAVAMRGAGSTYNDYVDREIDAKVERTRNRPLASGRIAPRAALWFIVAQCLIGLFVLLSFNGYTIALGFLSPLIVLVYPFAKRFTSWPQAILGFAFAYGAMLGWTAITGSLAAPALLLYASCILWTIGFDTIYALQDVRDDAIAGVRSTARLFGAQVKRAVSALYAGSALCAALAIYMIGGGFFCWLGVAAYAAHLAWQVSLTRADAPPETALALFRSNRDAGLLLFGGLFLQSATYLF